MNAPIQNDRIARFTALIDNEAGTLDELCQRVTDGETLVDVCKAWDVPHARVAAWLEADAARWEVYERALKLRADALVAETIAISDGSKVEMIEHVKKDGTVIVVPVLPDHQRDRLRFDARLKVAARWDKARFGGETEVPVRKAVPMGDVPLLEVARRLAFTLARGAQVAERQARAPRLLEGRSQTVAEPVVAAEPEDGEI